MAGHEFDRYVQRYDHRSTLTKVQQQYWEAKQTFLQKVKRKEDDCVVAADCELDAKLEVSAGFTEISTSQPRLASIPASFHAFIRLTQLFKSIEETNLRLLCILEAYQERVCILAHEESAYGRHM